MKAKRNRWFTGLLLCAASALYGQSGEGWRYWTINDGMMESYSRDLSRSKSGEIWSRHGMMGKLSILDGEKVRLISDPVLSAQAWRDWRSRVWPDERGGAWSLVEQEILQLTRGRWRVEVAAKTGQERLDVCPLGDGRLLVLSRDRIEVYDPATKRWDLKREASQSGIGNFRELIPGFGAEVWIAGETGVGRLSGKGEWESRSSRNLGMGELDHLAPGVGGQLVFSGSIEGRRGVAQWDAEGLKLLARDMGPKSFGWPGPEGAAWILDGRNLYRMSGAKKEVVPRRGRLSSEILSVVTEPDGGFWLGTVDGLLHRKPSLWATPAGASGVDQHVHDIAEDKLGRLWFAATNSLVSFDGKHWAKYLLPAGYSTHNLMARALLPMKDGRIFVKAQLADRSDEVFVFDPSSAKFKRLERAKDQPIRFFKARRDGTVVMNTGPGFRIESFDGSRFEVLADLTRSWQGGVLKDLMEMEDGRFWLAGAGGGGILAGSQFSSVVPENGWLEDGFFALWQDEGGRVLVGGRRSLMEWREGHLSGLREGMDRVRSVMRDRAGTVWMATATGVLRITNGHLIRNGEEDGLPSGMTHKVFEDSKGRIWAGTTQGLSLYGMEKDTEPPHTLLSQSRNTRQASASGFIRIALGGTDRWKQTEGKQLLFSWRLDEGAWTEFTEADEAQFEGLAAGRRKLEVKSMDRNGNIERNAAEYWFEVPMPWYRENAFLALATAMALTLGVLLVLAIRSYRERGKMVIELRSAREDAEAASRQKSIFLANMSHEIRTPMNAILGMNQLALETPAGAEQQDYLKMASQSAGELLNLLNDILDLSKVEAGKLDLLEKDFDLAACVGAVVTTLGLRAREKGLKLEWHLEDAIPRYVVGDEHRLRQVLFNLVGNGLKFTERGGVSIEVALVGEQLHWAIRDSGGGIPADQQKKVFAPFVQADGTATRKHGGTGLGLAITLELVKKMGGKIWLESPWQKPGSEAMVEGSTFHFTLPLRAGRAPATVVERVAEVQEPLRVLVAEDNAINQKLIAKLLSRDGHSVTLVSNGQEAVEALGRLEVDLVLMDVQMPVMDGLEATRQIRRGEAGRSQHQRIVAITANAFDGDREKCMAAGMDDYLTKPIQSSELRRILKYTGMHVD
ncbi:MAG: ATP-binding protein [Acidobacteria bacterium]|nr:ATP-binding protein [Acidobacteriota bacterium]